MLGNIHCESVSGEAGFRLGFVHHCPRPGWSGLYHYASILYHLTTARGLGSGARSVSENSDTKFEFAVQDAIKTPQAKARLSRDTFAMKLNLAGKDSQLIPKFAVKAASPPIPVTSKV